MAPPPSLLLPLLSLLLGRGAAGGGGVEVEVAVGGTKIIVAVMFGRLTPSHRFSAFAL